MMKSVMLMVMVMVMVIYLLPKYICKGASNHKYNKEKKHEHIVPANLAYIELPHLFTIQNMVKWKE